MILSDAQMNKILYYLRQCYEAIKEHDLVVEDNFIFLPAIEFHRDTNGKWVPN